jgi:hypothetical protein
MINRSLDDRKVEKGGDVGSKLGVVLSARMGWRSYARSTTRAGNVGFTVRDGARAIRISGSPCGPKSRRKAFHNSSRLP